MKATIDKITVTVGGRELQFTLAEAEALRAALNGMLGTPIAPGPIVIERVPAPTMPWRDTWTSAPDAPFTTPQIICLG